MRPWPSPDAPKSFLSGHLADSALHAPAAGFGDTEFYPEFIDRAAVLTVRLAKNHPLPDGNKASCVVAEAFTEARVSNSELEPQAP